MKLITLGDSITRGSFLDLNNTWQVATPNYSSQLQSLLGFDELQCVGINGISVSRTSHTNSEYAMSIICKDLKDADIFVIAGGTNDWATDVPLGDERDETDVTFYGGLHVLYSQVKKNNENAKIFAVLPINRKNQNTAKNKHGLLVDEYRAAIEKRAISFGFYVIDGRQIAFNPDVEEEQKKFMPDGLHPNDEGHKLYAELLYSEIKKHL